MNKNILLLTLSLLIISTMFSQETDKVSKAQYEALLKRVKRLEEKQAQHKKEITFLNRLSLKGYGVLNYYNNKWGNNTGDADRRNFFDTERLNLYLLYNYNSNIQFKAEIEFEHGGTGSSLELDKLEEFGEYEKEIEKGGKVSVEQMNILFKYKQWLNFRIGRVKLYMGNAPKLDRPTHYATGYRSKMENTILPVGWYENGIEILGDIGKEKQWSYKIFLVNGLNSEEFSSANWIKRGHQKKFEVVNAENFAISYRIDRNFANESYVGMSGYFGDSNKNRTKVKLDDVKGYVSIIDFHTNINLKNLKFRGMVLYGHLQNSDKISYANYGLQKVLGAKRTPVAKTALGYYGAVMYDISTFINKNIKNKFFLFLRYDFYDTMYSTKKGYFDNPRWEREEVTFGINYFVNPKIVFKGHYSINKLGINALGNKEKVLLFGIGFNI